MKDIYDLTSVLDFSNFPWREIATGIVLSKKESLGFYGYAKNGIFGDSISLTVPKESHGAWYRLGEKGFWINSPNIQHFTLLQNWIDNSNIFKNTGRIIFFIQPIGVSTPAHIDEIILKAPIEYQQPSEFIWITPPINGKQLIVNNTLSPYASWFNSYKFHSTTLLEHDAWSLRIDGKFTDDFKHKIDYDIL